MQNNTFPTLFIGQNLIKLKQVDSTNNYLKGLLSKSEPLPDGTVIMAEEQFAGRGQQNNKWLSEPGSNLTVSIFLRPGFLPATKQFDLNICISIGVINALKRYLGIKLQGGLKVKWPNDIYFHDRKIGGMLIENMISGTHLKQTVAGIGLNINQINFSPEISDKAASLAQILQHNVEISEILTQICMEIEVNYLKLRAGNYTASRKIYVDNLYKNEEPWLYRQNGDIFEGIIKGITDTGLLKIASNGIETSYNFKEIEFLNKTLPPLRD